MKKSYHVYILTNLQKTALYIGVTGNLEQRIFQHKNAKVPGFTKKYKTNRLIYFEEANDIRLAIQREKQLKKWNRQWKENLINKVNPHWDDLSESWN